MSQAEDLQAIHDYFNRTAGKTVAGKAAKESWNSWYNSLNFLSKMMDSTLVEAKNRRVAFDVANGEAARPQGSTLTAEEANYFANMPVINVTGMTPAAAKKALSTPSGTPAPASLVATGKPVLRRGAKNGQVKEFQQLIGITPADGNFGPGTEAAVKKFQADHGIKADGVVGAATWTAALGTKKEPSIIQKIVENFTPPTPGQTVSVNPVPSNQSVAKIPAAKPAATPTYSTGFVETPPSNLNQKVQAVQANMLGGLRGLPLWGKVTLGVATLGGLWYALTHRKPVR